MVLAMYTSLRTTVLIGMIADSSSGSSRWIAMKACFTAEHGDSDPAKTLNLQVFASVMCGEISPVAKG